MARTVAMRALLIAGSILIIIGVTVVAWMLITEEDRSNIEVYLSDGKTEIVEFDALSLVPGSECEYVIVLKNDNVNKYTLELDFTEKEEKTLKNFARVKILVKGEAVYDELLANALNDENITFSVDFGEDKNTELTVVYYLPIEVGNEAKNAEAIFELLITASNQENGEG